MSKKAWNKKSLARYIEHIQKASDAEVLAARPAGKQLYVIHARYQPDYGFGGLYDKICWYQWFDNFAAAQAQAQMLDAIGVVKYRTIAQRPDLEDDVQVLRGANGMNWPQP